MVVMSKQENIVTDHFIEQMGMVFEADSLPRIAGHIFGLMILDGGPLSLQDLTERLEISRASASTNARLLEAMGALERGGKRGDRQAFYRLGANPFARMMQGWVQRMTKAKHLVATTRAGLPESQKGPRQRLGELDDFYTEMIAALGHIGNTPN